MGAIQFSDQPSSTSENTTIFVSGDGADKAYVWQMTFDHNTASSVTTEPPTEVVIDEEEKKDEVTTPVAIAPVQYRVEKVCELAGHTETVEFCKFDSTGKWLVTGGMNNQLRVWDVKNGFTLKKTIDSIPQEDLNFVEWHNMAPCLMTGGKDYMIWLVNALTGKVMTNLIGHEDEVIDAKFTKEDRGKHIVSCSADKTIRVWSPLQAQSVITLKSFGA